MSIFRSLIERKLSSLFGSEVTFEQMKISVLGGSLEAKGMSVAGEAPGRPRLTVRRIAAEIVVTKALAGQLVIKSLVVEGVRASIDLAALLKKPSGQSMTPPSVGAPPPSASASTAPSANPSPWRLEAQSVQLKDGEIQLRDETNGAAYQLRVAAIGAELRADRQRCDFKIEVGSIGLSTAAPVLTQLRVTGSAATGDLTLLAKVPMEAAIASAQNIQGKLTSPNLSKRQATVEFFGKFEIAQWIALAPPSVKLPDVLRSPRVSGQADLSLRGDYSASAGLQVKELIVRAVDVHV